MDNKPTTLMYLVTEDWYFRSHRLSLASRLATKGFKVVVGCRLATELLISSELIEYIGLPFRRSFRRLDHDIVCLFSILRIVQFKNPDIVHAVALKPILLSILAVLCNRRTQFVFAFSGMGYVFSSLDRKAGLIRKLLSMVLRFLIRRQNSWVLVQNQSDYALIQSLANSRDIRVEMIAGSGVDTTYYRPVEQSKQRDETVVVLAARMLRDKGVFEFVEAATIVSGKVPQTAFWLVGPIDTDNPGALTEVELNELLASSGAIVTWKGYVEDMREVYYAADIICLPSYREGLPKVLLEAAACGKALVATDVPGCNDICRPNKSGLLVPPHDAHALAKALTDLLENPEKQTRYGQAAREIVEAEYSLDAIERATRDYYDSILDTTQNN